MRKFRFLKRAWLLLWLLPPAWFLVRWSGYSVSQEAAGSPRAGTIRESGAAQAPAWQEMSADETWLARLRESFQGGGMSDEDVLGFMRADLPRGVRIRTLLEILPCIGPDRQAEILDLLATLQPIEAAPRLIDMLREARGTPLAVKLLETLRSATLVTASAIRIDYDSPELKRAFELIQQVFLEELSHPDADGMRFRAAVAAVSDVFPGTEAMANFAELEQRLARNPADFPLTAAELDGAWLEAMIGTVDGRDFNTVMEFVRNHPQALSGEQAKARVGGLLSITPIRADEIAAVAPLFELLEPADAPDDSFVRWLELKSRLTGTVDPAPHSLSPMRKAALIHFGSLDSGLPEQLRHELTEAAARLPISEEREFLESAAAKLRPVAPGE